MSMYFEDKAPTIKTNKKYKKINKDEKKTRK